ncbi:MAG: hypothetical protein LBG44_10070 [Gemmatimonadota bacterium]|nr:hypothetical protein [Gemmatimonadota bacterium]
MALDNEVLKMTPGEALLDVPMGEIIRRLATSISDAQLKLDQNSIKAAIALGETRLDLLDTAGNYVSRSLLELGFTPTFYQFTDTTIEVKVTLSIKVEEGSKESATASYSTTSGGGTGASKGGTGAASPLTTAEPEKKTSAFGITVTAEHHRKYEFDTTASSSVTTKMLAVPPPSAFLEAIRTNFRIAQA